METGIEASASESRERRTRLRRPSHRTARRAATVALLAAAVACALFVWPGFLSGGTAYVIVSGQSMEPTLHAGDVVVTVRHRTYDVGDVVAYRIPEGEPGAGVLVIHRIVAGSASSGYITQGDDRNGRDPWRPRPQDVVGAEGLSVPRVGLALVYLRTPLGLAALAGIVTALLILGGSSTKTTAEGAGATRSLSARLRRGSRDSLADGLDDASLGRDDPVAADAPESAPPMAAITAPDGAGRPAITGPVVTLALLVAVILAAQRHL
ncbi:MAG: signal peptidase I [Gaiellaceae bacterium]